MNDQEKTELAVKKPGQTKLMRALRLFCLQCQGEMPGLVRSCAEADCPLHAFRMPDSPVEGAAGRRPVRAARLHCLTCAGERSEVRGCDAKEGCPLWPYRFGVMPQTYERVMARIRTPKALWLPGLEPPKK